jgi:hypothetical protein
VESAYDSAKWYTGLMPGEQPSLFDRKKYSGVLPQTYQIGPPTSDCTVLKTLPAYHTYLRSGGYSKYTPDDFTSDVKKFGLFVKDKKLREILTVDIQVLPLSVVENSNLSPTRLTVSLDAPYPC